MIAQDTPEANDCNPAVADLQRAFLRHLQYALVKEKYSATRTDRYTYLLPADYASYVACQYEVDRLYRQTGERTRTSILNTAAMGTFSSDRTIAEYAREIWGIHPENVCRHSRCDLI